MKKLFLSLTLIFLSFKLLMGQDEKFKVLYIYNFSKYIEWPTSYKQGDFIIGVVGNSSISKELEIIAEKKKVGFQTIVVKKFTNIDDIEKCHMLFVCSEKNDLLQKILSKLSNKPTLIITDKPGMAKKGAGINFENENGKLAFEINKNKIESNGLKVSSTLVALGKEVQ